MLELDEIIKQQKEESERRNVQAVATSQIRTSSEQPMPISKQEKSSATKESREASLNAKSAKKVLTSKSKTA